jgi:hypothetical protein
MRTAQDFIDACHQAAALHGAAPSGAPATAPVAGIVYRRVWPTPQSLDWLDEMSLDAAVIATGWLDSTLDLRDGLSVVEVFTAPVVADDLLTGISA